MRSRCTEAIGPLLRWTDARRGARHAEGDRHRRSLGLTSTPPRHACAEPQRQASPIPASPRLETFVDRDRTDRTNDHASRVHAQPHRHGAVRLEGRSDSAGARPARKRWNPGPRTVPVTPVNDPDRSAFSKNCARRQRETRTDGANA